MFSFSFDHGYSVSIFSQVRKQHVYVDRNILTHGRCDVFWGLDEVPVARSVWCERGAVWDPKGLKGSFMSDKRMLN